LDSASSNEVTVSPVRQPCASQPTPRPKQLKRQLRAIELPDVREASLPHYENGIQTIDRRSNRDCMMEAASSIERLLRKDVEKRILSHAVTSGMTLTSYRKLGGGISDVAA